MNWIASFRILFRRPTLSLLAILTTALAVGANTAIFSVARAVFLRPLGFPNEQRLVEIRDCNGAWYLRQKQMGRHELDPRGCISVSGALYQDFLAQSASYDALGAMNYDTALVALTGGVEPLLVRGYRVTPSFFRALETAPLIGRWLDDYGNGRSEPERQVVLGYGLWRDRFGGDPAIIGRDIQVAGAAHRVVGVMPAGMTYPRRTQLWLPHDFGTAAYHEGYGGHNLILIGRLKPGVSVAAAQAEATAISSRAAAIDPKTNQGWSTQLGGLVNEMTFRHRQAFLVLCAAVGIVLLIACANLSNLLLASLEQRSAEMAVRAALGASRRQLFQQVVGESVGLSLCGGALGLPLVWWGIDLLRPIIPANVPRGELVSMDVLVALFSLSASLFAGVVFGMIPGLRVSAGRSESILKAGVGRAGSRGGVALRGALVCVQIALAVVLLAGAGLLMNTLRRLGAQDLGFRADHLLVAQVPAASLQYRDAGRLAALGDEIVRRASAQPGVLAAAAGFPLPFTGDQQGRGIQIEGHPETKLPIVQYRSVSPGYFAALRIPLLQGRAFVDSDRSEVCVINRTLARLAFGGENALGRKVSLGGNRWNEVVGIVADVRHQGLDRDSGPEVYVPWATQPFQRFSVAIRYTGNTQPVASALRQIVTGIDPNQPLGESMTMDDLITRSTGDRRFPLVLFSVFGGLALAIAAVGIYGVVSHSVASRTQEMGIRLALGAGRKDLFRLILTQALTPVAAGLAVGVCLAAMLSRYLGSLLFGVRPTDPVTLAATCAVLATVSVAASLGPSLRAGRADPVEALRSA